MTSLPLTTTLLLSQISDFGQSEAWEEFDRRYRPMLLAFGRSLGLGHEDAADMAQTTLADLAVGLRDGKYDRKRGRLRSWILGIARNRAARIAGVRARGGVSSVEIDAMSEETLTELWEDARRRTILDLALNRLREHSKLAPSTLTAFELVALRGVPAAEAAKLSGLRGPDDVYVARSRVTRSLREIVASFEAIYDEAG